MFINTLISQLLHISQIADCYFTIGNQHIYWKELVPFQYSVVNVKNTLHTEKYIKEKYGKKVNYIQWLIYNCYPPASYLCNSNCVAVVQRPELDTDRSVVSDSDSDSDPDSVTRYRTCGLSGKKPKKSNTQICIGEYP